MSTNAEIGLSRKQVVFACLESTFGTLQLPSGTLDFIRPAGNADISQNPEFTDSEELANTLDVLDRFQGAMPPAKWSIPMYLRPDGIVGNPPQGHSLFTSLMGSSLATWSGVTLAAAFASTSEATCVISGIDIENLPHVGVIKIAGGGGNEYVFYSDYITASSDATLATLTGCIRGYNGTTAATGTEGNPITLQSKYYRQTTTSPSLSIWVQTDFLTQGISGASVSEAAFEISNEGAVKITLSGEAMQMVWAGTDTLVANAATNATCCYVNDANRYSVGAWVYCASSGTNVRKITIVDTTENKLTWDTALDHNWATADTVSGYLPTGTVIGDPVLSKDTSIQISSVDAAIKSGTLTVKCPKKYLSDEVGNEYAEDFLEEVRDINSTLKIYFRKEAIKYFAEGYVAEENTILLTFGDTAGYKMCLYMPKAILEVPTIEVAAPALELSIPMKAIGTVGEDSLQITMC